MRFCFVCCWLYWNTTLFEIYIFDGLPACLVLLACRLSDQLGLGLGLASDLYRRTTSR